MLQPTISDYIGTKIIITFPYVLEDPADIYDVEITVH